ncbi:uncharacterized protein LOC126892762 [Diabrotica virgifera virgifera]|uniref:Uncharacterized protein n=1 Tax=Diabrotica virgifera virgifera TaxID=50390 RepID=A0ABM5L7I4_DIAVI|nr:uncharacterized protein LOC126892762 [Diabrotica virgifera virgifera]
MSMLEYGSAIFYNSKGPAKNNIKVAETTSLRQITRMRHPDNPLHNPSNRMLYEETGIEPINERLNKLFKYLFINDSNKNLIEPHIVKIPEDSARRYPGRTLFEEVCYTSRQ